jgi:hypothetical protein
MRTVNVRLYLKFKHNIFNMFQLFMNHHQAERTSNKYV